MKPCMRIRSLLLGVVAPVLFILLVGPSERAWANSVTFGALKDATIYDDGNANGGGNFVFAGANGLDVRLRSLLAFDLSGISPGSTITGVTLTLHQSLPPGAAADNRAPNDVSLHRALADWVEGTSVPTGGGGGEGIGFSSPVNGVTFSLRDVVGGMAWTNTGGDFVALASATTSVGDNGPYMWSGSGLVTDVQGWLNSPSTNFGWFLTMDDESMPAKRFRSRQNADSTHLPALTIDFTPPTGPAQVPEPSTVLLLASGLAGLALWRRRKTN